jgi:hypothetical protein
MDRNQKKQIEYQIRRALAQEIFDKTKALTPAELKAKNQEDEKLKITLLDNSVTSVFEQKKLVSDLKQPYKPIFPNENPYYLHAFRLLNLPGDPKKFIKHKKVRIFTLNTVYKLMPKEVMQELYKKNPFLIKILRRRYKLFEYLDSDGRMMLLEFRDSINEIANRSADLYEFNKNLFEKHGVMYQLRLFK